MAVAVVSGLLCALEFVVPSRFMVLDFAQGSSGP